MESLNTGFIRFKEMAIGIISRVRDRVRQHLVLQSISFALGRLGLDIVPYYVCHESISTDSEAGLEPKLTPLVAEFLSPAEIDAICLEEESGGLYKHKDRLINEGCLCFGLKYRNEIVSYMWCHFRECWGRLATFPLREDEVYLFQAVTFNTYRGNNLAPFLRSRLYGRLYEMGRTKIYSVTEAFNYPAVRFKEKLGAKQLRLGIYFCLFSRWKWNLIVRHYEVTGV